MEKQKIIEEVAELFNLYSVIERRDIEVKNQKYFEAAKLRDLEKDIIKKIKERINKWN